MFDLLLQNNASKEVFILRNLDNVSETNLYLKFDNVTLPEGAKDGEYTYAIIFNGRNDVTYETNAVLLKTKVKCGEGEYLLKDLKPLVGIMKKGDSKEQKSINVYKADKEKNNETIYYYKK